MSLPRIPVPAEMAGRELARRRLALGLLTALPLAFYGARAHQTDHAAITGGIAMAFSIAGASIFAALTAREVDQRLVLAGYRPYELLLGRLLVLELLGVLVGALFSVVAVLGTNPAHPWALVGGVGLVAFTSVPFGLAVGALAPHDLVGVLILIGVVGIQLTLDSTQTIAKALPFWGGAAPDRPLNRHQRADRRGDPRSTRLRRRTARRRCLHHARTSTISRESSVSSRAPRRDCSCLNAES